MLRTYAVIAALLVALPPGAARADWLLSPNLGSTFGADAGGRERFSYGVSIGWMGAGIFGWEADLSYTPQFFEDDTSDFDITDDSNVVSLMGNVIVAIPIGGQQGRGFRPYVTGGFGVLQTEVGNEDDLFHVDNSEFGYNLGAGAMGFLTDRIGFRGDVRYFRAVEKIEDDFSFNEGNFDYWRGTVGVTFRW
ncbi:MAG: outer membrane protein [Gammaproteobacteria bacterium]